MSIEIREVNGLADIKKFVNFQFDLNKNEKMWVPPLKMDEIKTLTPGKNPAFEFCDAKFWLAYKNGKVVGRIGVIINKLEIEKLGQQIGRFTRLDFIDDFEVSGALLATAEKYVKSKGITVIHGPLGFANLDQQAILIEGQEHLPSVASVWHKAYYLQHLEKWGYDKEMDWVEFRLTIPPTIPEKVVQVSEIVKTRMGVKVKTFASQKELAPYAPKVFRILNTAFTDLFSFVPLNDKMIDFYVQKYLPILSPKFVKLILDKEDTIIGFIIGLPSLATAMQKANGKLLPFGWWHIMQAYKKCDTIDLLLTGMDPQLQGMGYPALMMVEMQRTAQQNGAKYAETTGMIETNHKAIQNWKNYEHIQHKRKRCFIKTLS